MSGNSTKNNTPKPQSSQKSIAKKNTPKVGVFLPCEMFNTLIAVLDKISDTKKYVGETDFSRNAVFLKQKILRYARKFNDGKTENAAVYFFEKEAAVLTELLIFNASFGEEKAADYFKNVKYKPKK